MTANAQTTETLLRQVIIELARLPEDDLPLVAEFVEPLKQTRRRETPTPAVAQIRAEARRRAAQLENVPRQELAARFIKVIDEIRAEAISKGVAISGVIFTEIAP